MHIDHLDLRAWVNDALMAFFFFFAGLEIKREIVHGDLRDPKAAALPAIAALGGMVVPAMIYVAFNHGGDDSGGGWGIPMATDIAFAVGVLSLLGDRVPGGAKIFLLTLAIADDIGAIVVIAIFYTDTLALGWLAGAVAGLVVMALLRNLDVRSLAPFIALGVWVWLALLESGVHATLAGVTVALLTPAWSFYDPRRFAPDARRLVDEVEAPFADVLTDDELERTESALAELSRLTTETQTDRHHAGDADRGAAGRRGPAPGDRLVAHRRARDDRRHRLHRGAVRHRPELRRPRPDPRRQDGHLRRQDRRRAGRAGDAAVGGCV